MAEATIIPYRGKGEKITREEAIEWFALLKEKFVNTAYEEYLEMAIKALEEEPKTGHWKRISMDKYVQHAMAYYRCSECGKDIIGEHNYCPNCGAKMVEPQESEVRDENIYSKY